MESDSLSALEYLEKHSTYDLVDYYVKEHTQKWCQCQDSFSIDDDDVISIVNALIRNKNDGSYTYIKLEDYQTFDQEVEKKIYMADMALKDAADKSSNIKVGILDGNMYPQKKNVLEKKYLYIYTGDETINIAGDYGKWLKDKKKQN